MLWCTAREYSLSVSGSIIWHVLTLIFLIISDGRVDPLGTQTVNQAVALEPQENMLEARGWWNKLTNSDYTKLPHVSSAAEAKARLESLQATIQAHQLQDYSLAQIETYRAAKRKYQPYEPTDKLDELITHLKEPEWQQKLAGASSSSS